MHPCRVDCQFKTIAKLAWKVRAAQRKYFRDRTQEALAASKALERHLDQAMQDAAKTPSPQAEFAFDAPPSSEARASLPVEQDNADEVGDHADALPPIQPQLSADQHAQRQQDCWADIAAIIDTKAAQGNISWLRDYRARLTARMDRYPAAIIPEMIAIIDNHFSSMPGKANNV
jgi:hypothetical protein